MRHFFPGFLILVLFQLIGVALGRLGVPLPPSILGLILFSFALATGLIKLPWVERAASFLLRHLILLFIPLLVGLPEMAGPLRVQGLALVASAVVSFIAVLLVTGGLAHFLLRDDKAVEAFDEDDQ